MENVAGNIAKVKTQNNEKIIEISTNFSIVREIKDEMDRLSKETEIQNEPKSKPKPKFIPQEDLTNQKSLTSYPSNIYGKKILRKMYMSKDVICKHINLTPSKNNFDSEYKRQVKLSEKLQIRLTILANLRDSPYVLNFLGITKLDYSDYMVCEFAERGNLKEIYERESIDWPIKIQLAVDICRGIAYIHGCNILHHDIRCENILVGVTILSILFLCVYTMIYYLFIFFSHKYFLF